MLEIKNDSDVPIDIILSPVQRRDDITRISIPIRGTFSSSVKSGCTKYLQILRPDEKDSFWEGIIPTCTFWPIIVDVANKEVLHNGSKVVSVTKNEYGMNFIHSNLFIILFVSSMIIIGYWMYKKYNLRTKNIL